MADTFIVTAPLIIVRNGEQSGRHEYLYQGSPVPSYVAADELKRLQDDGLVSKPDDTQVTPASSPDQLSGGVVPVEKARSTSRS